MIDRMLAQRLRKALTERIGVIQIISQSEGQVEETLRALVPDGLCVWTLTEGLRQGANPVEGTEDVRAALTWALRHPKPAIFFFKDLQYFLRDDPWVARRVRDIAGAFPGQGKALLMRTLSPTVPEDLRELIFLVEHSLPGRQDLGDLFDLLAKGRGGQAAPVPDGLRDQFLTAALGLSIVEAERAFRRALGGGRALDAAAIQEILEEKRQVIGKTGILEFVPQPVGIGDVGGMESLKAWLEKRKHVYTEDARKAGVLPPKGVLVMGISGCGKSLFIKAIAGFWGIPLLRLDMARVYGGLMGSAEEAMRLAVRMAEVMAPCVLWLDEMEAGISAAGHKAEGGEQSRVLGFFLTWMQEKASPVFVGATANAIDLLPAEVLRKGRFDEIFYISLPTLKERMQVLSIHLARRGAQPHTFNLRFLGEGTKGFSGSEIEQVVATAAVDALQQKRPLGEDDVASAISRTVPLSVTMSEQIKKVEAWAFKRAVPASIKEGPD